MWPWVILRLRRRELELVQVRTPDPGLNLAWRRAVENLDLAASEAHGLRDSPIEDQAAPAFAALAIGDFASARSILTLLRQNLEAEQVTPIYLRLVARYFAASGDLHLTRQEWPSVRAALQLDRASTSLLRELALTAESIGERDQHRQLVEAAASIDRNMGEPFPADAYVPSSCMDTELRDIASGADPSWPPAAVASFVSGILGFEPDAARNRTQLSPVVPADWSALEVDNLRVGESTLSLRYARNGDANTFQLLPGAGSIPIRVVFAPAVIGYGVSSVSVDGQLARLDLRRVNDRWVCPLQIELDRDRLILIKVETQAK